MKKEIFLCGEAVRDMLLNIPVNDYDYVCTGFTKSELNHMPLIGKDFPVYIATAEDLNALVKDTVYHMDKPVKLAMASTERGTHTDGVTLIQDLYKRDLTINSMARDITGTIIDPYGGQQDIKDKLLRHTSEAFTEDPVRVLRLARFRTALPTFEIHRDTKALVYTMRDSLKSLQPDRVWNEVVRVFKLPNAHIFFETLFELGVLDVIFPKIFELVLLKEGNKQHLEASVFAHTMNVMSHLSEMPIEVQLAGLFHDIAKPITYRTQGDSAGHEGIPEVAQFIVETFPAIPEQVYKTVLFLCNKHVKIHKFKLMKNTLIAGYLHTFKDNRTLLEYQIALGNADNMGRITAIEIKDIDSYKILAVFDRMDGYSPSIWITQQDNLVSSDAIKQHIHKCNTGFVGEHYE